MRKSISFCFLLLCVCILPLFAFGKKETEDRPAEKVDNWTESFDINSKKAGKYNIVVTAKDTGGNTTLAGPMNIFIDPNSDLPVCGITNPYPGMPVPGNLNIVGTCIDDDAVASVELVFDNDTEHPVIADGKDFWAHYLDTTKLTEGKHTIAVTGVDINGLRGNPFIVEWELNRHTPQTVLDSHSMGMLVSGKQKIHGNVTDGNGVADLAWSTDGGETFLPLKISYDKKLQQSIFDFVFDTATLTDGPHVIWFKAHDNLGTQGFYSILFFVDNTPPVVQIVSPLETDPVNGLFAVTGYARDTMNLTALSWSYGTQTGNLELIPGNPFWTFECDVRNQDIKNAELIISATDTAGNTTRFVRKQPVDQNADKSSVSIFSPAVGAVIDESLILQGYASDDDGIAEVYAVIDGNTADVQTMNSTGVFSCDLSAALQHVVAGNHTVTVWSKDIHGVEGNKNTVAFTVAGKKPVFGDTVITSGGSELPYTSGMNIHPESGAIIKTSVFSDCGIASVVWQISGKDTEQLPLKQPIKGDLAVAVPVPSDRWGYTDVLITAEDIYGRKTTINVPFFLKNLGIQLGDRHVSFRDSTLRSDATVLLKDGEEASLFFTGGTAKSVRLIPDTDIVSASLEDNSIILKPGRKYGESKELVAEITTDRGIAYRSSVFTVLHPGEKPVIAIRGDIIRSISDALTIDGKATGAEFVYYRTISASPNGKKDTVLSEWQTASEQSDFSIELSPELFTDALTVVEIRAVAAGGAEETEAVFITSNSVLPEKPLITWLEGTDIYYGVSYKGALSLEAVKNGADVVEFDVFAECGIIRRESVSVTGSVLALTLKNEAGKNITDKYTAKRQSALSMRFVSVDSNPYRSGMSIPVYKSEKDGASPVFTCRITSDMPVTGVTYTINESVSGKATIRKTDNPFIFEADIQLKNLPAQLTSISVAATNGKAPAVTETAYVYVVRPNDSVQSIEDTETMYWSPALMRESGYYEMGRGERLIGYGNYKVPFTAVLVGGNGKPALSGIAVEVDGNTVMLSSDGEGVYDSVVLTITDAEGITHKTSPISIKADFDAPSTVITAPEKDSWVQDSVQLSLSVSENVKLQKTEYMCVPYTLSTAGNATNDIDTDSTLEQSVSEPVWTALSGGQLRGTQTTYTQTIPLSNIADGPVVLRIRTTDSSGKQSIAEQVFFKDTQPPAVSVFVPEAGVAVNGETRIVFSVADNGMYTAAAYVKSTGKKTADTAIDIPVGIVTSTIVGTAEQPLLQDMKFAFVDAAGNCIEKNIWEFTVDAESDLPVAEIHVPEENEIIQTDFVISGVVYDDDGACSIRYKIDNGNYVTMEDRGNSYSIPVALLSLTDNEHTVTVQAEDLHGVRGPEVVRTFRISLEEPKADFVAPHVSETVKDWVTISGTASDKNGISRVEISLDNGNSYVPAKGTEKWSFIFDSHVIQDGTHVVFLKVYDGYEIQGLYSTLINVDNTAPSLSLDLPRDDSRTSGMLFFSGQANDNVGLEKLYCQIRGLGSTSSVRKKDIEIASIIACEMDISDLPDGFYNVEITGEDAGGNISRVSRNIELGKTAQEARVNILYPLSRERVNGSFNLYGTVDSEKPVKTVTLFVDGTEKETAELSPTGYFKFAFTPENLLEGNHTIVVQTMIDGNKTVSSNDHFIEYKTSGPWVAVDNFTMGDFSFNRAYLKGSAGYMLSAEDEQLLADKETSREVKAAIKAKTVDKVELSFNNGKTFIDLDGGSEWEYRIEDGYMKEGYHFMVLRATMSNGEKAMSRFIVQIDKTAPVIKLISPGEGGRYNQQLEFSGLSSDDVHLETVTLSLRSGDKSSYEIPGFIQGLYFDFHMLGGTFFDVGFGLTFFDDNVKLQVQYGQLTDEQYALRSSNPKRYGGNVFGAKLLANIFYLPFEYFAGPDWSWLSASFALGADFALFDETQSGSSQMLAAVLAQLEFPRIKIPNMKRFRTYSCYTEFQLWFAPSDRDAESVDIPTFVPQLSFGLRAYVF